MGNADSLEIFEVQTHEPAGIVVHANACRKSPGVTRGAPVSPQVHQQEAEQHPHRLPQAERPQI